MSQNSLKRDFHGGSVTTELRSRPVMMKPCISLLPLVLSLQDAAIEMQYYKATLMTSGIKMVFKVSHLNFYMVIIEVFIMLNPWNL